jgi:hypothetical protein
MRWSHPTGPSKPDFKLPDLNLPKPTPAGPIEDRLKGKEIGVSLIYRTSYTILISDVVGYTLPLCGKHKT